MSTTSLEPAIYSPPVNPSGFFYPASDNEPIRPTYGLGITDLTLAATPTDVLVIRGSATKLIRVKSIAIDGISATAGAYPVSILRRSAANTGGTQTNPVGQAHDPNDPAATAQISLYTANPSGLGSAAAYPVHAGRLIAASATNLDRLTFQYTWQNDKALILRGTSDFLAINLGGTALAASTKVDFDLTWIEE